MKSLQQRIEKLRNELRFQLKKESTVQFGKTTAPILDIPPEQVNNLLHVRANCYFSCYTVYF